MSSQKYILGISAFFHDSAAALVSNDAVIAAVQEERFSRKKADWRFPYKAIDYCLKQLPAGASLDAVVFYENPLLKLERIFCNAVINAPRGAPVWPRLLQTVDVLNRILPQDLRGILSDPNNIYFTSHHRSHAASAFYASPFEEAAVLVVDGVGEWSTTSIWLGDENGLHAVSEIRFPHSLGLFYSAFTQYCGFKVNSGEYKLMGLAPYGSPIYQKKIYDELIDVKPDGSFALNLKYFSFQTDLSTINPLFGYLFGKPAREPNEAISSHYMNVAASAQAVLNDVMCLLASQALKRSCSKNLCMAGGVALNCVANSQILSKVEDLAGLWVQPASGDAGAALGAALELRHTLAKHSTDRHTGIIKRDGMKNKNAYLGNEFDAAMLRTALEASGLVYENYDDNEAELLQAIARVLESGQIIAHFNGRMEFGPRALGNRSILADPRPKDMLKRANLKIKFREDWRPFAPVILAEQAEKFFNFPIESPYMLFVADIHERFRTGPPLEKLLANRRYELKALAGAVRSAFPAITHCDYSARLQTVTPESNLRLYKILQTFLEISGCPMLLNTSFNVRGEPIVCTPQDAISCFLNTNLDMLVLGANIVRKSDQEAEVQNKIGKLKFHAD